MNTPDDAAPSTPPSTPASPTPQPGRAARAGQLLLSILLVAAVVVGVMQLRRPRGTPVDPATLNLPFNAASARRTGATLRTVLDDDAWWSRPEPQRATALVRTLDSMKDTATLVVTNADGQVLARVSNRGGRLDVSFPRPADGG